MKQGHLGIGLLVLVGAVLAWLLWPAAVPPATTGVSTESAQEVSTTTQGNSSTVQAPPAVAATSTTTRTSAPNSSTTIRLELVELQTKLAQQTEEAFTLVAQTKAEGYIEGWQGADGAVQWDAALPGEPRLMRVETLGSTEPVPADPNDKGGEPSNARTRVRALVLTPQLAPEVFQLQRDVEALRARL
jgi:hypothetical protein